MTQEVKEAGAEQGESYPTIQDIRKIFENHGFDVTQGVEAGTYYTTDGQPYTFDWHFIQFRGDIPDEGFRGFEVAVEHGLVPVGGLHLVWGCRVHRITGEGTIDNDPTWQMEFQTADDRGIRGNTLCPCLL